MLTPLFIISTAPIAPVKHTTEPTETTEPEDTTDPSETTKPNDSNNNFGQNGAEVTYKEYMAMSEEEQYEFFLSFATPADFFAWQAQAKADDEANSGDIVVGGNGGVDFGDIQNGN